MLHYMMSPTSEAVQVSSAIFRAMNDDVVKAGRTFVLVFLPIELDFARMKDNLVYREQWRTLVHAACPRGAICLDLLDDFTKSGSNDRDRGFDGTHYGPKTNKFIAEVIARRLNRLGIMTLSEAANDLSAGHGQQRQ